MKPMLFFWVAALLLAASNALGYGEKIETCTFGPDQAPYTELVNGHFCAVMQTAPGVYQKAVPGAYPPGLGEKNLHFIVFKADPEESVMYRINTGGYSDGPAVTFIGSYFSRHTEYPGLFFCQHQRQGAKYGVVVFGQENLNRYFQTPLPQGQAHCFKSKRDWAAQQPTPL